MVVILQELYGWENSEKQTNQYNFRGVWIILLNGGTY